MLIKKIDVSKSVKFARECSDCDETRGSLRKSVVASPEGNTYAANERGKRTERQGRAKPDYKIRRVRAVKAQDLKQRPWILQTLNKELKNKNSTSQLGENFLTIGHGSNTGGSCLTAIHLSQPHTSGLFARDCRTYGWGICMDMREVAGNYGCRIGGC